MVTEKRRSITFIVYFSEYGTMFVDKYFDVDTINFMIVDGIKYKDTPDLYELIFKRISDDTIYTENDKLIYKSILLATNDRRSNPIVGSKGYKYKNIIAPLVSDKI